MGGKGSGRRAGVAPRPPINACTSCGRFAAPGEAIRHEITCPAPAANFEPPGATLPALPAHAPPPVRTMRRAPDRVTATAPAPKRIRTEGQRLLLNMRGSLAELAAALGDGVSRQSVLDWRNGESMPGYASRARMETALQIPVETWAQRPHPEYEIPDMPYAPPDAPDEPPAGGTSLQDCMRLLATVRAETTRQGLLPSERIKLVDAEAKLLKLRVELESHAELSEDRYVREHPAWLRARNAIADALRPHPAAATAVAEALERLGL